MTAPNGQAALDNARQVTTYEVGYCLKYVRSEAWRIPSLYGSAIDAWYGAVDRHPLDRHPPIGAPMFYSGGQYGHIVVCVRTSDAKIRSTDMPHSGTVSEGAVAWPETNWGCTFLGWASDLNGVDLPLESEDDEMTEDDWKRLRGIVRDEVKAEMNQQRPSYVSSILAGEVNDDDDTVKAALRIGLEHARGER